MGKFSKSSPKFYSVVKGRQTGIFSTWGECEDSVKDFSGAVFRSFTTRARAEKFLQRAPQTANAIMYASTPAHPVTLINAEDNQQRLIINNPLRSNNNNSVVETKQPRKGARSLSPKRRPWTRSPRWIPPRCSTHQSVQDTAQWIASTYILMRGGSMSSSPSQHTPTPSGGSCSPTYHHSHQQQTMQLGSTTAEASSGPLFAWTAPSPVEIYCDGACSYNQRRRSPPNGGVGNTSPTAARAGYGVFFGSNDRRNISAALPASEKQTNNRAEMRSIIAALETMTHTTDGSAAAHASSGRDDDRRGPSKGHRAEYDSVACVGGGSPGGSPLQNNAAAISRAADSPGVLSLPAPIWILSDSLYCVKGITDWIDSWKANNWCSESKKNVVVENVDLWRTLDALVQECRNRWVRVLLQEDHLSHILPKASEKSEDKASNITLSLGGSISIPSAKASTITVPLRGTTTNTSPSSVTRAQWKEAVEYIALVEAVKFFHVKGHSGIFGNEMADRLAVLGVKRNTC